LSTSNTAWRLAEAFFTASRNGDMKALGAMLAADVSVHADGGGKRPASLEPVVGFDAVMKVNEFLAAHFRQNPSKLVRAGFVNGLPRFHHTGGRWQTSGDGA